MLACKYHLKMCKRNRHIASHHHKRIHQVPFPHLTGIREDMESNKMSGCSRASHRLQSNWTHKITARADSRAIQRPTLPIVAKAWSFFPIFSKKLVTLIKPIWSHRVSTRIKLKCNSMDAKFETSSLQNILPDRARSNNRQLQHTGYYNIFQSHLNTWKKHMMPTIKWDMISKDYQERKTYSFERHMGAVNHNVCKYNLPQLRTPHHRGNI